MERDQEREQKMLQIIIRFKSSFSPFDLTNQQF